MQQQRSTLFPYTTLFRSDWEINDISPTKIFVPKLIKIEIPIAIKKNIGSIQDDVERIKIKITIGTKIAAALNVSCPVAFCEIATSSASPASALSSPMTS